MKKMDFYLVESNSDTGKRKEKKFSNSKPCKLFTNFTILIRSFCLVLCVAPISLFFIFYFISLFTIFTIYYTFHSILSMNDIRDITNFTTYVFQIDMSPITKNNFNYSLYFLTLITFYSISL